MISNPYAKPGRGLRHNGIPVRSTTVKSNPYAKPGRGLRHNGIPYRDHIKLKNSSLKNPYRKKPQTYGLDHLTTLLGNDIRDTALNDSYKSIDFANSAAGFSHRRRLNRVKFANQRLEQQRKHIADYKNSFKYKSTTIVRPKPKQYWEQHWGLQRAEQLKVDYIKNIKRRMKRGVKDIDKMYGMKTSYRKEDLETMIKFIPQMRDFNPRSLHNWLSKVAKLSKRR